MIMCNQDGKTIREVPKTDKGIYKVIHDGDDSSYAATKPITLLEFHHYMGYIRPAIIKRLLTMVWPLDFKSTLPLERWYSASHASMQRPLISLSQRNIGGSVPRNPVMRFTLIYGVLPPSPPFTISSPLLTTVHNSSTYTFFIISVKPWRPTSTMNLKSRCSKKNLSRLCIQIEVANILGRISSCTSRSKAHDKSLPCAILLNIMALWSS